MFIEPSFIKTLTGYIFMGSIAVGFCTAIYQHLFSDDADDNISECGGMWLNVIANGILIAIGVALVAYGLNSLIQV